MLVFIFFMFLAICAAHMNYSLDCLGGVCHYINDSHVRLHAQTCDFNLADDKTVGGKIIGCT